METVERIVYAVSIAMIIPVMVFASFGLLWTLDEWILKPIFGRTFLDIRWK